MKFEYKRVLKIIELLKIEHPVAKIVLKYNNNLELLVATILSAQCTDKQVNKVTKNLFKKYKKAEDYAYTNINELENDIRSTGFYRNKAKNIQNCCKMLIDLYNSEIPMNMKEILELPGVGRKTANIVLSHAYGVIEGIAVDTHVKRLVKRLGLTEQNNPDKIERDLMEIVPKSQWMKFTDLLIFHGRRICSARNPKCGICVLKKDCPSSFSFEQ